MHQFNIFSFKDIRPHLKVPISAQAISKAKEQLSKGEYRDAAKTLREIRERLENFERRHFAKKQRQI